MSKNEKLRGSFCKGGMENRVSLVNALDADFLIFIWLHKKLNSFTRKMIWSFFRIISHPSLGCLNH